jgi:hypothetical protein
VADQRFHVPDLSPRARRAALAYGQAFTTAKRSNYATRRTAIRTLQNCRELLSPDEIALLDMVAGRRALITGVAKQTSCSAKELWNIYEGACETLAIAFGYSNHTPKSEQSSR